MHAKSFICRRLHSPLVRHRVAKSPAADGYQTSSSRNTPPTPPNISSIGAASGVANHCDVTPRQADGSSGCEGLGDFGKYLAALYLVEDLVLQADQVVINRTHRSLRDLP